MDGQTDVDTEAGPNAAVGLHSTGPDTALMRIATTEEY